MSRYIDADAFEAFGYEVNGGSYDFKDGFDEGVQFVLECIDNVPTADVRENVRGEWVDTTHGLKCSACGTFQVYGSRYFKYCPVCGAEMRGGVKYEGKRCRACHPADESDTEKSKVMFSSSSDRPGE